MRSNSQNVIQANTLPHSSVKYFFIKPLFFFCRIAYSIDDRTPHTSHASDVSHGETFFYQENLLMSGTHTDILSEVMDVKEPITYDEQVKRIAAKGFIIENPDSCKEFLMQA